MAPSGLPVEEICLALNFFLAKAILLHLIHAVLSLLRLPKTFHSSQRLQLTNRIFHYQNLYNLYHPSSNITRYPEFSCDFALLFSPVDLNNPNYVLAFRSFTPAFNLDTPLPRINDLDLNPNPSRVNIVDRLFDIGRRILDYSDSLPFSVDSMLTCDFFLVEENYLIHNFSMTPYWLARFCTNIDASGSRLHLSPYFISSKNPLLVALNFAANCIVSSGKIL